MSKKFGVFNPLANWKRGDLPIDPIVKLTFNEGLGTGNGFQLITSSLASSDEIDSAIDQLQKDLEYVRSEAKRVLHKQKEKILVTL